MTGVISDCGLSRMRAAVSNPSMIGIRTSSKMTANSCAMTHRRAASPESASTIGVAERRQHGLQRQPLGGIVVDHQDRNALTG